MDPYIQQLIKDVATLQADVAWLTWWVRLLIGSSVLSGLVNAGTLAFLVKNNKSKN